MKLNPDEDNILRNIKSQGSKIPLFYFIIGMSTLAFSLSGFADQANPLLKTFLLFFGGFLTGSGIEKYYNRKISKICLKLYEDFKARNRS